MRQGINLRQENEINLSNINWLCIKSKAVIKIWNVFYLISTICLQNIIICRNFFISWEYNKDENSAAEMNDVIFLYNRCYLSLISTWQCIITGIHLSQPFPTFSIPSIDDSNSDTIQITFLELWPSGPISLSDITKNSSPENYKRIKSAYFNFRVFTHLE